MVLWVWFPARIFLERDQVVDSKGSMGLLELMCPQRLVSLNGATRTKEYWREQGAANYMLSIPGLRENDLCQ